MFATAAPSLQATPADVAPEQRPALARRTMLGGLGLLAAGMVGTGVTASLDGGPLASAHRRYLDAARGLLEAEEDHADSRFGSPGERESGRRLDRAAEECEASRRSLVDAIAAAAGGIRRPDRITVETGGVVASIAEGDRLFVLVADEPAHTVADLGGLDADPAGCLRPVMVPLG